MSTETSPLIHFNDNELHINTAHYFSSTTHTIHSHYSQNPPNTHTNYNIFASHNPSLDTPNGMLTANINNLFSWWQLRPYQSLNLYYYRSDNMQCSRTTRDVNACSFLAVWLSQVFFVHHLSPKMLTTPTHEVQLAITIISNRPLPLLKYLCIDTIMMTITNTTIIATPVPTLTHTCTHLQTHTCTHTRIHLRIYLQTHTPTHPHTPPQHTRKTHTNAHPIHIRPSVPPTHWMYWEYSSTWTVTTSESCTECSMEDYHGRGEISVLCWRLLTIFRCLLLHSVRPRQ